jgi:hypothetical protein
MRRYGGEDRHGTVFVEKIFASIGLGIELHGCDIQFHHLK